MKIKKTIFLYLLILEGCASVPRVKEPHIKIDLPSYWTVGDLENVPHSRFWWKSFEDTQLDSFVVQGLRKNFDLQAAAARIKVAIAQARVAGSLNYPQLMATATRWKQDRVGFPKTSTEKETGSAANGSFGVSLELSWEVDLWGRIGAGKAAAMAKFQAKQAMFRAAQLSLIGQIAKVWFAVIETNRQVELAHATVENYQTSKQQIQRRYERGLRPSLDLRLTLVDLGTAKNWLYQQESKLDFLLRQLEILLGRFPKASIISGSVLPSVPEKVPFGLPAELISRRPDLVVAERQLSESQARVVQARRAIYPKFSLTGSGGRVSNELGDLLNGGFGVWNLMGNVLQPLLQGGRIRGEINMAKSYSQEAQALFFEKLLRAYGEVESALASDRFLSLREQALETVSQQALAARHLAEERYNIGLTDLITMLSAQRSAYQSESQLLSVRRQRLEARIDLHLALGGGFSGREEILFGVDNTLSSEFKIY